MKKLFALVLTLHLLCGTSAPATGDSTTITVDGQSSDTIVTYKIQPNKTFSVTIPATAKIDSETNEGSMVFAIDAPEFNAKGWGVSVNLMGSVGNFNLKNGDKAIPYKLKNSDGYELGLWNGMIKWNCDGTSTRATTTVTLEAMPENAADLTEAGVYSDTLNFTVYLLEPIAE